LNIICFFEAFKPPAGPLKAFRFDPVYRSGEVISTHDPALPRPVAVDGNVVPGQLVQD
jgi:hypothetical protein